MPGLEDLYREIILDHYRSPRNRGELAAPPAVRADGFNPLCGDEIVVYLDVDDTATITDVAIGGQGCSISQASASMMSAAIKGKKVADVRRLIAAFKGLMSIHEADIGGDGSETRRGSTSASTTPTTSASATWRRCAASSSSGADQVRDARLEHARPGARRGLPD
ncbi:MAG: SUF system NifU family Fe-S cluster assembly protein [Acidimicrobiales bacterium]